MDRRTFLTGGAAAMVAAPLMASGKENAAGLPTAGTYDLVVAGGSATGVCAAVTAARAGLSVAIVEYNAFFGGTATAGLVPVWHSLYSNDGKQQIIHGLTDEIEKKLLARGEAMLTNPKNPYAGCFFNVAAMQIVLDDVVAAEKNITPYLKCHFVDVIKRDETHIDAIVVEDKSGRRQLKAKWFIDATGDADLTYRAGFETWKLDKADFQAQTLCAIFANRPLVKRKYPKFSFDEVMKTALREGKYKHVFQWEAPVVGAPNLVFVAATRVSDCDPSIAEDLTQGLFEARRQVRILLDIVNRDYPMPEGEGLALVSLGSDLGVRESRHIKAKYRVTTKDILYGRHFDDCIGKGTYRVDIHEGKGITFRDLDGQEHVQVVTKDGDITYEHRRWRDDAGPYPTYYEIPFRALVPEKAANLLCAGRMIDCERDAYGALRVMVNCNQMGEAAANAVVRYLKKG